MTEDVEHGVGPGDELYLEEDVLEAFVLGCWLQVYSVIPGLVFSKFCRVLGAVPSGSIS